jgi:hypothetical protein
MRRRPGTASSFGLLLCLAILGASPLQAGDEQTQGNAEIKDLTRTVDPIVIRGEALPALLGLGLDGFRLFSAAGGALGPVPFQIDEVDEDGLYVLPEGTEPNKDKGHRGKDQDLPNALDTNDELVFMASDLGDRVPSAQWPAGIRQGSEIEVRDPATGRKGWAYLYWFEKPPPASAKDYVRYSREEDRIHTPHFSLGYSPAKDLVYTAYMTIDPKGKGGGVDIMDRINIRFSASIFLQSITFGRTEDDFVSRVIAYKDGPVRAMRRVANSMRLVLGLQTPKIIAYSVYYRDTIETPNVLHLPVSLASVCRSAYFEGGTDYNHLAYGMRFFNPRNPAGVVVDGRMSPEEQHMDLGEHAWTLTAGEQGNILNRVEMGEGLKGVLTNKLIYIDDLNRSNAPEGEPGTTPKIGFSLENLLALKKGTYRYNARFYFVPDTQKSTVSAYVAILDNPLEVRIK